MNRHGTSAHALDMDQRYLALRLDRPVQAEVEPGRWHVTVLRPVDGLLVPPGRYTLTAVDSQQRPSVTEWVRLGHRPG